MKLEMERWVENSSQLTESAIELFQEALICYKNMAYRSAYIMSYLAFMSTIRERVLSYKKCPNRMHEAYWEKVCNDLNDEQAWEEVVLNLLGGASYETNYLLCMGDESINEFANILDASGNKALLTRWNEAVSKLDQDKIDFNKKQKFTIEFKNTKQQVKEKKDSGLRGKSDIFGINSSSPDFSKQLLFYRTLRNQCAHGKIVTKGFESCYVECLWSFMRTYLPQLHVGGTLEYWKERLFYCYKFYKDDKYLYDEFFRELEQCSFGDNELSELWQELIDNITLDVRENEIIGDIDFLKYILENEWCRNSFLECLKCNLRNTKTVDEKFILFYVKYRDIIYRFVKDDIGFWKGTVYDKLKDWLPKIGIDVYFLFEIWYDLCMDLSDNEDKQIGLICAMELENFSAINYRGYEEKLKELNYFGKYFDNFYKKIDFAGGINNRNNDKFITYWENNIELYLWFINNALLYFDKENPRSIEIVNVNLFLLAIKETSEKREGFLYPTKIAKNIINEIKTNKYDKINELYNSIARSGGSTV